MDWWLVLAGFLVVIGLLGTFLPILPGVPIIFIGLLLAAWTDEFVRVSVLAMSIIGIIAALSMIIDFIASFVTTKKVGASKNAIWGMAIGGVLGLFGGPFGIFFGAAIGALLGELSAHRDMSRATTVGLAAGLGFALGLIAKLLLAMVMLGIFAYTYYY